VDPDVTDPFLIKHCFAFVIYHSKYWNIKGQHLSSLQHFKTASTRDISYNIIIEFGVNIRIYRSFNESISTGKQLSVTHKFLIPQDMEQGALSFPLIFNFASEYVIWLGHEKKQGLIANEPHQFLVNANMLIYWVKTDTV
jgi:hypothetical protein